MHDRTKVDYFEEEIVETNVTPLKTVTGSSPHEKVLCRTKTDQKGKAPGQNLMMEAMRTCESSVNFCKTKLFNIQRFDQ